MTGKQHQQLSLPHLLNISQHVAKPLSAWQVLLEKGVCESKILFLSLIAAPEGIHKICSTFPSVKVITSEIDSGIGEDYQVVPGGA